MKKQPSSIKPKINALLHVDLGLYSYPILIGSSILNAREYIDQFLKGKQLAIVTNEIVAEFYLKAFRKILNEINANFLEIILPDGEKEKNWANLMKIFDCLLGGQCDRKTTLIALGGGVIGDLTGFAASSYMRGIPFVQIPTTLLAQVDSSVGGKTGINHPLGKNMIGSFYQPKAVIIDTMVLKSLPRRELHAGLAEIIKYGAAVDISFFEWLEININSLIDKNNAALTYAIHRSCELKSHIVSLDEREENSRAILNFGHTFGHAIESGLGYGKWLHGEAVGCGMAMAADLSYRLGYISNSERERVIRLIKSADLPIKAPNLGSQRWLSLMKLDKKSKDGQTNFVLMKCLGNSVITSVPRDILLETLENFPMM